MNGFPFLLSWSWRQDLWIGIKVKLGTGGGWRRSRCFTRCCVSSLTSKWLLRLLYSRCFIGHLLGKDRTRCLLSGYHYCFRPHGSQCGRCSGGNFSFQYLIGSLPWNGLIDIRVWSYHILRPFWRYFWRNIHTINWSDRWIGRSKWRQEMKGRYGFLPIWARIQRSSVTEAMRYRWWSFYAWQHCLPKYILTPVVTKAKISLMLATHRRATRNGRFSDVRKLEAATLDETRFHSRESITSSLTGFMDVSNSGLGLRRLHTSLALCFVALARPDSFPWTGGGDLKDIADAARSEGNEAELLRTGVCDLDCSNMEYEGLCRAVDEGAISFCSANLLAMDLRHYHYIWEVHLYMIVINLGCLQTTIRKRTKWLQIVSVTENYSPGLYRTNIKIGIGSAYGLGQTDFWGPVSFLILLTVRLVTNSAWRLCMYVWGARGYIMRAGAEGVL